MAFPSLAPTARAFEPGDWPVRTYEALSGAEVRIRYGNKRTGAKLSLSYDNITDAQAEEFLTHYNETNGTFYTFSVPVDAYAGWGGDVNSLSPGSSGAAYRYAGPPQITALPCGKSTVRVELIGVI